AGGGALPGPPPAPPTGTPTPRTRPDCCARAPSGHAAAPASSVMNSRRFMSSSYLGSFISSCCATRTMSSLRYSLPDDSGSSARPQSMLLKVVSPVSKLNVAVVGLCRSLDHRGDIVARGGNHRDLSAYQIGCQL